MPLTRVGSGGFVVLVAFVLPAGLPGQGISVVTRPGMRPAAVLVPHVQYSVAADSADGAVVVRDLAVGPVAFAGMVRVDGVQPGARGLDARPFPDTARFEPDGRVILLRADGPGRPPLTIEVIGSRGAAAGRIGITARDWPVGRALLVTFAPADVFEAVRRGAGFGERDRVRIDDRAGVAYLTDATTGPTTVAVGFGRGAQGRIQEVAGEVLVERDFGGAGAVERRQVGGLTFALEPAREEGGVVRAEIVFGVGVNEAGALQAARAGAAEPPAASAPTGLVVATPAPDVSLAATHALAAAGVAFDWDVIGGTRAMTASAREPVVRATDVWYGGPLAVQRADTAILCGSYRLLRDSRGDSGEVRRISLRLGAQGRYLAAEGSGSRAALALAGYACYRATREPAFLRSELPGLLSLVAAAAAAGDTLTADALDRLAQMDEELARLDGRVGSGRADSLRAEAERRRPTGGPVTAAVRWQAISGAASNAVSRQYGRMAGEGQPGGLAVAAAGAWLDAVAGDLYGVDEQLDGIVVAPGLDGIADAFTWRLEGWRLARDTIGISYRPADRAATIRVTAFTRRRLYLAFPWLAPNSCVRARRGGGSTETLPLVRLADGSYYTDLRAFYDPAIVSITATPCGG